MFDPSGDYFGDYNDLEIEFEDNNEDAKSETSSTYESDKLGGEFEGGYEGDSEDEYELEVEALIEEEENGLEPPRPSLPEVSTTRSAITTGDQQVPQTAAFRLRGGAEEALREKPYVVKFGGRAGEVIRNSTEQTQHSEYLKHVGNAGNPYAPFTSRMEWEVARWAKLRGPGSTSFSELMAQL